MSNTLHPTQPAAPPDAAITTIVRHNYGVIHSAYEARAVVTAIMAVSPGVPNAGDFLSRWHADLATAAILAAAITGRSYHAGLAWAQRWNDSSFREVDQALATHGHGEALQLWQQRLQLPSYLAPALASRINWATLAWAVPGGSTICQGPVQEVASAVA